jgi:hypothetical protein
MKRTLISTGLVAAFGLLGNVQAQGISATDALNAPTQFFMSGATANTATILSAVKTAMCGGTTAAESTQYAGSGGNATKFYAIACNSPLSGGNAVFYYTALGSNFGINPALYNGTGVKTPKLNLNTCSGTTTCTGITSEANSTIPDVGYSDINPTAFTGPNTPDATSLGNEFNSTFGGNFAAAYPALFNAMKEDSAANGDTAIYPVNGMTFAILISNTLATALGGTANSYPLGLSTSQSVSTPTIAGLMSGAYTTGLQALRALGITDPSPSNVTKVAVCTRPATSGTKAWANTFFLGAGAAPKKANATAAASGGNWSGQAVAIVENLGSSDLRTCMNRASAQGIPAIGISSLEVSQLPLNTTPSSATTGLRTDTTYAVARIDGVSPDNATVGDRINTRNGLYTYVGEATMQGRGDLSADQEAVKDAIVAALNSSSVCALSGPTTQPDGAFGNATGCETKWSRGSDAFARAVTAAGE